MAWFAFGKLQQFINICLYLKIFAYILKFVFWSLPYLGISNEMYVKPSSGTKLL